MTTKKNASDVKGQRVEGEGSYSATRNYNKHLGSALADKKGIERGAEAARKAVEGPEGAALRAAEAKAKAGPRMTAKRAR
jgi:hypothetical protein